MSLLPSSRRQTYSGLAWGESVLLGRKGPVWDVFEGGGDWVS